VRILLIYPFCLEQRSVEENVDAVPIGLYSVAATLLADGFEVEVLNWHSLPRDAAGIRAVLKARKPRLIGFSVLQATRFAALDIARAAKKLDKTVTTVFGGPSATFLWEHFLTRYPQVDYAVLGEGERSMLELARAVRDRDPGRVASIPGLAFRAEGRPARTPDATPVEDLDSLPIPAEHFTYRHLALTRGCPGKCAFCGSPKFWGPRVRFRSAEHFVREIELLHGRGVSFLYVSDDTFTLRKKLVAEVCRLLVEKRLPIAWAAISRVDSVDARTLVWMRKAGCIQVSYGVESGSPTVRARLGKRFSNDEVRRAFELTARAGLLPRAYFIYGSPGETADTIRQSVELLLAVRPLAALFHVLVLFPGTALYEEYKRRSGLTDDIWLERMEDVMYFATDPALSVEFMREARERLHHAFHANLPAFAAAVELDPDPGLAGLHADFLSRLGLTFDRGDYAGVEEIPDRAATAGRLYERALGLAPDARAYLGLGMRRQRSRDFPAAVAILAEGLKHFPANPQLTLCLAVCRMNLGEFAAALDLLLPLEGSPDAAPYLAACRERLGRG
jgi:radical SAM superfamily enzyme YgiQ (UPF0313 family)